jgi:hypothetical protein
MTRKEAVRIAGLGQSVPVQKQLNGKTWPILIKSQKRTHVDG